MSFSELYLIYYPKLVRFAKEFVMSEEDAGEHNARCVYRLMGKERVNESY